MTDAMYADEVVESVHMERVNDQGHDHEAMGPVSPFGRGALFGTTTSGATESFESELVTPFSESMALADEAEFEAEATAAFLAEIEDDEFEEALEALTNEAAARHLRSLDSWSSEAMEHELAADEVERWVDEIGSSVDQRLDELELQLGERPIDELTEAEFELIHSDGLQYESSPFDAQEFFFKKLWKKAKKAARTVGRLAKKGVRALGKLLPLKKLLRILRRVVKPLLKRVVRRAIGKLPRRVRPIARKLARRFGAEAEADPVDADLEFDSEFGELAREFDKVLTQALMAPDEGTIDRIATHYELDSEPAGEAESPIQELDIARRRLAEQLLEIEENQAPVAEMEQFLPAVMAARPIIKLGIKIIGRKKVVRHLAKLIARLIQGMVGKRAARMLSTHIASTGLRLIGFEAESSAGELVGSEALVATVEDTINELMETPEVFENDYLLEAAVEEAFSQAAVKHLPGSLLRAEVVESHHDEEAGMWVMMPRQSRIYRYKKYSEPMPVRITRPLASSIVMSEGETLEERMLDAGITTFPVEGEIDMYEMLPGGEIGHLAAFEGSEHEAIGEAALEFEELAKVRGLPLPASMRSKARLHRRRGRGRRVGSRVVRIRVRGAKLTRRAKFSLRLDLTGANPQLRLHLLVGERDAHSLATNLKRRRHVKIAGSFRRLLGGSTRMVMQRRLTSMLKRRKMALSAADAQKMADRLAEGAIKEIANRLPSMSAELERAAADAASGVTITVTYVFGSKRDLVAGKSKSRSVKVRPGRHRD